MLYGAVKDNFGHYYKLHLPTDGRIPDGVQSRQFNDPVSTKQFIRGLEAQESHWRFLTLTLAAHISPHISIEEAICQLLINGRIKVFDITDYVRSRDATASIVLKGSDNNRVQILPASAQFIQDASNIKDIVSHDEAFQYLAQLEADDEQLRQLAGQLEVIPPSSNRLDRQTLLSVLAESIVNRKIVVLEKSGNAASSKDSKSSKDLDPVTSSMPGNRPPTLGPSSEVSIAAGVVQKEEKEPICSLVSVTVSAPNGREAIVNSKSKTIPKLAVVATEKNKKGFKEVAAEVQVQEMCGNHNNSSFKVSKEHKLKSRSSSRISLDVSCDSWNINNAFERVWLPSTNPKTYKITAKPTCQAPDMSVTTIEVDVYPDMTWHWETQINFGKLEFIPGQAKVKYSDLAIDGNVKLTYDGEDHDLKEKYKKYIQDPLDGFKKICDVISKVLEAINDPSSLTRIGTQAKKPPPPEGQDNTDGNETRLVVTWPNLDIKYDATLSESKYVDLVDHEYRISLAADPLLDIDIQVDVLDTLMKVAPAGTGRLIKFAKERIEEGFDGKNVAFRGELDIIFTAKSTVTITEGQLSGKHNILKHEKSGEPIKGTIDIPVALKGATRVEGKWFFITFDINYSIRGDAGWRGEFEFGKDEKGIYCAQVMEFTGIVVTFTKYEEVSAEVHVSSKRSKNAYARFSKIKVENDDKTLTASMENGNISGKATKKVEKDTVWKWLEPQRDTATAPSRRYYLIEH